MDDDGRDDDGGDDDDEDGHGGCDNDKDDGDDDGDGYGDRNEQGDKSSLLLTVGVLRPPGTCCAGGKEQVLHKALQPLPRSTVEAVCAVGAPEDPEELKREAAKRHAASMRAFAQSNPAGGGHLHGFAFGTAWQVGGACTPLHTARPHRQ